MAYDSNTDDWIGFSSLQLDRRPELHPVATDSGHTLPATLLLTLFLQSSLNSCKHTCQKLLPADIHPALSALIFFSFKGKLYLCQTNYPLYLLPSHFSNLIPDFIYLSISIFKFLCQPCFYKAFLYC